MIGSWGQQSGDDLYWLFLPPALRTEAAVAVACEGRIAAAAVAFAVDGAIVFAVYLSYCTLALRDIDCVVGIDEDDNADVGIVCNVCRGVWMEGD